LPLQEHEDALSDKLASIMIANREKDWAKITQTALQKAESHLAEEKRLQGAAAQEETPSFALQQSDSCWWTVEEKEVWAEMNKVRTHPSEYAECLKYYLQFFNGTEYVVPGKPILLTKEGASALEECINFLSKCPSVPALEWPMPKELCKSALDHCLDTGPKGLTGHIGTDGSKCSDRINRYGVFLETCGENISYGYSRGKDIVRQLLVDDGVTSRGHRTNIMSEEFHLCGVAIKPHSIYESMCTIVYTGGFRPGISSFDRSRPFKASSSSSSTDMEELLAILPFDHIIQSVKEAWSNQVLVTVDYKPPGNFKATIGDPEGACSMYNCTFG